MSIVRTLATFTLVAVTLVGAPAVQAAGAEEVERALTHQGQSLADLLSQRSGGSWAALSGALQEQDGTIAGVARSMTGQGLSDRVVRLTRVETSRARRTPGQVIRTRSRGELIAQLRTGPDGSFEFVGLSPGRHVVEVLVDGRVVTSASAVLQRGNMHIAGLVAQVQPQSSWWSRRSTGAKIGILAGIGLGAYMAVAVRCCYGG